MTYNLHLNCVKRCIHSFIFIEISVIISESQSVYVASIDHMNNR